MAGVCSEENNGIHVKPAEKCKKVIHFLRRERGIEHEARRPFPGFRICPEPVGIDRNAAALLARLGADLHAFYHACRLLYQASVMGSEPAWVKNYLEAGKPDLIVQLGRLRSLRREVPIIIRPDILWTDRGPIITELDAVPGGFGLVGALASVYSRLGVQVVGGKNGTSRFFGSALQTLAGSASPVVAIVVSEESRDYWGEMEWMAGALREQGMQAWVLAPDELQFRDGQIFIRRPGGQRVEVLYRFFELFDWENIPGFDLIVEAMRKGTVTVTPPMKTYLEEKMLFFLFQHPDLQSFWRRWLSDGTLARLRRVIPRTWVVDPQPLPPPAVIPGLKAGDRPVTSWNQLREASQSERQLVLKPSGFSDRAWGSRGVIVGHDVAGSDWGEAVARALKSFPANPYVLQRFHKGSHLQVQYYDWTSKVIKPMEGRVRLCPYYFVCGNKVKLGAVLATVCSLEKKVIHGMTDAVMVPVAVARGGRQAAAQIRLPLPPEG